MCNNTDMFCALCKKYRIEHKQKQKNELKLKMSKLLVNAGNCKSIIRVKGNSSWSALHVIVGINITE